MLTPAFKLGMLVADNKWALALAMGLFLDKSNLFLNVSQR